MPPTVSHLRVVTNTSRSTACAREKLAKAHSPRPEAPRRIPTESISNAPSSSCHAPQRRVVVLRYVCDLPESEVAAALGCSVGTVKSHASRGLATLRRLLTPALEKPKRSFR